MEKEIREMEEKDSFKLRLIIIIIIAIIAGLVFYVSLHYFIIYDTKCNDYKSNGFVNYDDNIIYHESCLLVEENEIDCGVFCNPKFFKNEYLNSSCSQEFEDECANYRNECADFGVLWRCLLGMVFSIGIAIMIMIFFVANY